MCHFDVRWPAPTPRSRACGELSLTILAMVPEVLASQSYPSNCSDGLEYQGWNPTAGHFWARPNMCLLRNNGAHPDTHEGWRSPLQVAKVRGDKVIIDRLWAAKVHSND
jgi:hypothetical protein